MRESKIEAYLTERTKNVLGGRALKFLPYLMAGMPDRILLLPGGQVLWVETKAPGEKLRPKQKQRQRQLQELGFYVAVIDSIEGVDLLIEALRRRG